MSLCNDRLLEVVATVRAGRNTRSGTRDDPACPAGAGMYVGNHVAEINPQRGAERFSQRGATPLKGYICTAEIWPVSPSSVFTVTGAVPGSVVDREISQSRGVSRMRALASECGRECKHVAAT